MWKTKDNEETARKIINVLAEKNYTVAEAQEVLRYVSLILSEHATVQKADEKLFTLSIDGERLFRAINRSSNYDTSQSTQV